MYTSYMAISNLSVVVGTKLIGLLTTVLSIGHLYILLLIIGLLPAILLKAMNPRLILELKELGTDNFNKEQKY